jgi:hypothetical protein
MVKPAALDAHGEENKSDATGIEILIRVGGAFSSTGIIHNPGDCAGIFPKRQG